ncbi:hypothetical protein Bpfe_012213 [Biomphalaria pfeifferi]|uniref:Uncharacterized protein n=1 Tax=Biomphalaria pfeifferi TaxID=112525 RepID=A0AAD8BP20_BIOPF|nr:hypothetical protein Bpfe_012213 [Biomphalaria pfeifferi]
MDRGRKSVVHKTKFGSRRQVSNSEVFENLRINYSEFHKDFSKFIEQLPSNYRAGVQAQLYNIKVLPTVLSPSDFNSDEVESVLKKLNYVLKVFEKVLDKIYLFMKRNDWFDDQKVKLQWWISLVKMSANIVKQDTENNGLIRRNSSGIGGFTKGLQNTEKGTQMKQKEIILDGLLKVLDSK